MGQWQFDFLPGFELKHRGVAEVLPLIPRVNSEFGLYRLLLTEVKVKTLSFRKEDFDIFPFIRSRILPQHSDHQGRTRLVSPLQLSPTPIWSHRHIRQNSTIRWCVWANSDMHWFGFLFIVSYRIDGDRIFLRFRKSIDH